MLQITHGSGIADYAVSQLGRYTGDAGQEIVDILSDWRARTFEARRDAYYAACDAYPRYHPVPTAMYEAMGALNRLFETLYAYQLGIECSSK